MEWFIFAGARGLYVSSKHSEDTDFARILTNVCFNLRCVDAEPRHVSESKSPQSRHVSSASLVPEPMEVSPRINFILHKQTEF